VGATSALLVLERLVLVVSQRSFIQDETFSSINRLWVVNR